MLCFCFFRKVLLYVCLCYISNAIAQDHVYTQFTTAHGLSSSKVYDITQDNQGNLWFATDRGLTSYDGYEFKKYTKNHGLTDVVIYNFYNQSDGTILCSTLNKKLFYIDPKVDKFIPFDYNHVFDQVPTNTCINTIITDAHQNIFINFKKQSGYFQINKKGKVYNKLCDTNKTENLIIKNKYAYYTCESDNFKIPVDTTSFSNIQIKNRKKPAYHYGTLVSASASHLVFFENNDLYIKNAVNLTEKHLVFNEYIKSVGVFDNDHFWVASSYGGLKIYNYEGMLIHQYLVSKSVTKIFKDHEDGIWLSTLDSGVFYIKNSKLKSYATYSKIPHVVNLTKNDKEKLFIGHFNGKLYTRSSNQIKFLWESKLHRPVDISFHQGEKPQTLIGSFPYFLVHHQNKLDTISLCKVQNFINNPLIERIPDTISLTLHQKLKLKYGLNKKFSLKIQDIVNANNGYYLGAISGLYFYKNGKLHDLRNTHPLYSNRIEAIDYIGNRLMIASLGAGLIIKDKDSTYTIQTENGLNSNIVNKIYAENAKEIYLATNQGLNKISFTNNMDSYKVYSFSFDDGLPCNEINDIEILNDTIWIGTKHGLYTLPNTEIIKTNKNSYKNWLTIDKVSVPNKTIAATDEVFYLNHKQNSINLKFQATSFRNAKNTLYRYRLLGQEKAWNITKGREVRYDHIDPGSYTFELQTKGGNKDWNNESTYLHFNIDKPFWQTNIFYSIFVIVILGIGYCFFKYRILLYNNDIVREILRLILSKIKNDNQFIVIKESGIEIKLNTSEILFAKAAGNYLEINTLLKTYLIREKISEFEKKLPDQLEFMRIHRSYLIRIDKVDVKNHKFVQINNQKIPVSNTYKMNLNKIIL